MLSFNIVGYVWQILGRGPNICEQPWKNPSWIWLNLLMQNYLMGTNIFQIVFDYIIFSKVTNSFSFILFCSVCKFKQFAGFISRPFVRVNLRICILLYNINSMQVQSPNCRGNWSMSAYSNWYCASKGVGTLGTSCCNSHKNQVNLEQMLKILINLLIFLMLNTFSWGHSIITLSKNIQTFSLVRGFWIW